LSVAALAAFGVGTSYADSVATTGGVTSVTSTSARLNGTINAGSSDVGWIFEYDNASYYKATGAYRVRTLAKPANPGLTAVSASITGLAPSTTYHFQLFALDQVDTTQGPMLHRGGDLSFTTAAAGGSGQPPGGKPGSNKPKYGKASLRRHRLQIRGGVVSIPLQCKGSAAAACQGKVSLTVTHKVGRTVTKVSCGHGKFVGFGGSGAVVRTTIGSRCAALLNASPKHSISATLKATFSTHQATLKRGVTLFQ
jgi:hypothetical protein